MALELVTFDDYKFLFNHFITSRYNLHNDDPVVNVVQEKCEQLFSKDYKFSVVNNAGGRLCNTYPPRILFLEEKFSDDSKKCDELNNNVNKASRYSERVKKSKSARCRRRFPVPVILVDGKYICRSSTLAGNIEIYPTDALDYIRNSGKSDTGTSQRKASDNKGILAVEACEEIDSSVLEKKEDGRFVAFVDLYEVIPGIYEKFRNLLSWEADKEYVVVDALEDVEEIDDTPVIADVDLLDKPETPAKDIDKDQNANKDDEDHTSNGKDKDHIDNGEDQDQNDNGEVNGKSNKKIELGKDLDDNSKVGVYRIQDIQLLKDLSISRICDLMVEERKVKYMVSVTSSEKADKYNRYKDFSIMSMPYPGCEFFKLFRENDFHSDRMRFNWNEKYINRNLEICEDNFESLNIDFKNYKEWDLTTLTENYMKVLIKCIADDSSGLLIHCISGWDRTPLFVSLLRMSLWADGKVHQSLSALELLYLTVGYDWFLFGHQLIYRLAEQEEIMKFCFCALKFLSPADFSVIKYEQLNSDKRSESPLLPEENPIFTERSNISDQAGIDILKDMDSVWLDVHEDLQLPPKNLASSLLLDPQHLSCGSVESLDELSTLTRANTPPTMVQSREDETSILPLDAKSASPPRINPEIKASSPLAVPNSSRRRTESTSSDASYLMITGTGSVPQSVSSSSPPDLNQSFRSQGKISDIELLKMRKPKLKELRAMFMNMYYATGNVRFKSGRKTGVIGFISNFTEQCGIKTPKPPS